MTQSPEQVLDRLYYYYGTDSGMLFGIPASLKSSVFAIVKVLCNWSQEAEPSQEPPG